MIKDEIKLIKETKKDLRNFGITVGTVLVIVAVFLFFNDKSSYIYFGSIGLFLILAGLIFPRILKPLNKAWMILAVILGFVMTRVILSILFYLVLTPLRFIAALFGKKFLDLKFDRSKESYWEKRKSGTVSPVEYERQF